MCGEKEAQGLSDIYEVGSPPRVRGKEEVVVYTEPENGITPACAGKRLCYSCVLESFGDHPRVCGEKSGLMRSNATGTGSPPRVRGKALFYRFALGLLGITPACAGKRRKSL